MIEFDHNLTEEDIEAIRQYKKDVRAGKIHPIKYEGNLRDLID